jgi:hypothetical protein
MLSLYKLSVKVRKKLDGIRIQFLWQGTSLKKKFALINLKWVCMLRQLRGLGVGFALYEYIFTIEMIVEIERSSIYNTMETDCMC